MTKDLKWLKEELGELPCVDTVFNSDCSSYIDSAIPVMAVYDLINQLDEPEVLSQEWIDEHRMMGIYKDSNGRLMSYFALEDLQNLLVPKQEKVKIESLWAEDIEEAKENGMTLFKTMNWMGIGSDEKEKQDLFARAWLDGYQIEEEQKYYVLNKELQPKLCKSAGMSKKIMESNSSLTINEKSLYREQYKLTEQEIKDYDERYWPFAIKVEELEE